MGKDAETQLVYYLKGTGYKLGLLINFGANRLDIKRRPYLASTEVTMDRERMKKKTPMSATA